MFKWLLLLVAYLPFQIALNPRPEIDLASLRLFIILLFGVWLLGSLIAKSWPSLIYFKNIQAVALSLFLILAFFSLFGAENISWGFRKLIFLLSVCPLYILVVVLANNRTKIKKIMVILVKGGGLIALIGLSQFLSSFVFGMEKVYQWWAGYLVPVFNGFNFGALIMAYPSWLVNLNGQTIMRAFSLFSDPHMLSFYLGMILPLIVVSICLKFRSKAPKKRSFAPKFPKFLLSVYGLLFITLLLTFTRGAYLAVIVTFLVLGGLLWKYLKAKKIALLLCLSLMIFIIPGTPIADRFYSSFDLSEGSNIGRLEMWQQAGQSGLKNFWQGLGLGGYSLLVEPGLGYRSPATAHNLYLDIFSEMGVFVLAVWLVLILGTLGQLFLKIGRVKQSEKYLCLGLIGSLVYFSIHSFFETAIYNPIILALLMVVFGLSSSLIKARS